MSSPMSEKHLSNLAEKLVVTPIYNEASNCAYLLA
jgi:hypothetical protein